MQFYIAALFFHFLEFRISLCFQIQNLINQVSLASIARWEEKRAHHLDSVGEESGFASSKDWDV